MRRARRPYERGMLLLLPPPLSGTSCCVEVEDGSCKNLSFPSARVGDLPALAIERGTGAACPEVSIETQLLLAHVLSWSRQIGSFFVGFAGNKEAFKWVRSAPHR